MQVAQGVGRQHDTGPSGGEAGITMRRIGGYTAIGGAVIMLGGAALWASTGADLWHALDTGDMAGYLTAAGQYKGRLVANLSLWIVGVLFIGVAQANMVALCHHRRPLAWAALTLANAGVSVAIVAMLAMMVLVVQLVPEPSATAIALANVVGWVGARADDLATVLLIGATPWLLALAAHDEWMPGWLARWGYLAGVVGLLSLVLLYVPILALKPLAFVIVPVGIFWLIAAGVVLLRRA